MAPVTLTDPAKLAAMHDLHVLGPLRVTQAFFPYMSATATARSRAKIVNIGSVISHGFPWYAAYATTKVSHRHDLRSTLMHSRPARRFSAT